ACCRLALHGGFCFRDFEHHLIGKRDAERLALMAFHRHLHAILQEGGALTHPVTGKLDLLIGLVVHEGQHPFRLVEILVVLLLKPYALNGFSGTEPLVQLAAIDQVLEFDLCEGAALAGLHMLHFHRSPEASFMLDDVAGTDFVAVNLHGLARMLEMGMGAGCRPGTSAGALITLSAADGQGLCHESMYCGGSICSG